MTRAGYGLIKTQSVDRLPQGGVPTAGSIGGRSGPVLSLPEKVTAAHVRAASHSSTTSSLWLVAWSGVGRGTRGSNVHTTGPARGKWMLMKYTSHQTRKELDGLLTQLRTLHVNAGEEAVGSWPDDHDALAVLDHVRRYARRLPPTQRPQQARLRLQVGKLLQQRVEAELLTAVDHARPDQARREEKLSLEEIADVIGVDTRGAVTKWIARLRGGVEQGRRDYPLGRALVAEQARRQRQEEAARNKVLRRHPRVLAAAHELLAVWEDLAGQEWQEELADYIGRCEDTRPSVEVMGALAATLGLAATECATVAAVEGQPPASTPRAQKALEDALSLRQNR